MHSISATNLPRKSWAQYLQEGREELSQGSRDFYVITVLLALLHFSPLHVSEIRPNTFGYAHRKQCCQQEQVTVGIAVASMHILCLAESNLAPVFSGCAVLYLRTYAATPVSVQRYAFSEYVILYTIMAGLLLSRAQIYVHHTTAASL